MIQEIFTKTTKNLNPEILSYIYSIRANLLYIPNRDASDSLYTNVTTWLAYQLLVLILHILFLHLLLSISVLNIQPYHIHWNIVFIKATS